MKHREIILSVKRSTFRVDDPHSDDSLPEFKKNRKLVLERDNHACGYCGFRSAKFQEVHHLDDNHNNNDLDNLITACPLCHMCHHIGFAGFRELGDLIRIDPKENLTQASLNSLVRSLWIAECSSNKELAQGATSLYNRLHLLSVNAKRQLGTNKPDVLARFMINLDDRDYSKRKERLEGIYFLPSKEGFAQQLDYWKKAGLKSNPTEKWTDIASDRVTKWAGNEFDIKDAENVVASFLKHKRISN